MYYHPFQTTVFENVDKIIEKELMIPSQMHTNNLGTLRSLELFKLWVQYTSYYSQYSIVYYFRPESLGNYVGMTEANECLISFYYKFPATRHCTKLRSQNALWTSLYGLNILYPAWDVCTFAVHGSCPAKKHTIFYNVWFDKSSPTKRYQIHIW